MQIELGSNATLVCPFKNFNHFEWLKNSKAFNNSNNTDSVDITFHEISTDDQGLLNFVLANV